MVPLNRMDTFCFNRFVLLGWSAAVFESQSTQTVDLKDVGIANCWWGCIIFVGLLPPKLQVGQLKKDISIHR